MGIIKVILVEKDSKDERFQSKIISQINFPTVCFLIFRGHWSFSCSHWYPCFGLLVMSALSFKARVDFWLARFLACRLFLRFTSRVTPADCIEVSMAAKPFWSIPADMSTSIGRDFGLEPTTICATRSKCGAVNHSATPQLLPNSYNSSSRCVNFLKVTF